MSDPTAWLRALRAGVRVLVLRTPEEGRAVELLERVAEQLQWPLHTWSAATGVDAGGRAQPLRELLLDRAPDDTPQMWVLFDPGAALADPGTARALRELAQRPRGPAIVVLEPSDAARWSVPPEAWATELPPPAADVLQSHLAEIGETLERGGTPGAIEVFDDGAEAIARAALGLGLDATERLVAEAVLDVGLDASAIAGFVTRNKAALVPTDGLLDPMPPADPDELGGHRAFKAWVEQRALALQPRARPAGIPAPRGVLLLGVQGCGKSLAARTTAHTLELPLFRLDPGRLFGGTVGRSEQNLRRVLAALDTMAPVVVWLDEIDKGLAGAGGGRSDAGTAARVMGGLLTWLSERHRPVFVVATANDVAGLPPELLRRGRLDEIFFFDLPDAPTRSEILRVHLETAPRRRLGQVPPMADPWSEFAQVAAEAEGFSGAELEAALTEARLSAFARGRALSAGDLRAAIAATVPLSVTRAESVETLRRWAATRTRPA